MFENSRTSTRPRIQRVFLCSLLWMIPGASASAQNGLQAEFRTTSVVRITPSGDRQMALAVITSPDSLGDAGVEVQIRAGGAPIFAPLGPIPKGTSNRFFELPVIRGADSATIILRAQGKALMSVRGLLTPPRRWRVYDVQVSHHDLGYADYYHFMRRDVRELGIEMALDFCRRTDSLPSNERFRWTVETSEPLTKFIGACTPAVVQDLTKRIKEGRIELGALHNSVYTEMMGYESMARLFYTPNRTIVDLLDIPPSRTALITDVVGFARTLPTFLKEAGIPYFYHGYNETVNGMSPASANPVFFWRPLDGNPGTPPLFRSFPYYSPDRLTKYDLPEISGLLARYEQGTPWPYDCLIAEDSYDFSVPQFENIEGIRRWNGQYRNPVLISGTFTMFFDDVMRQARPSAIPSADQDAPNAWADQDATDGKLMADARLLNFDLPTVEKLSTFAYASGGKGYPWKEIWQAYHRLISYHEHTNGAFSEEDVLPIPFQKTARAANANYYECEQVMHKGLVSEAREFTQAAKTRAFDQFRNLITTDRESTLVVFNPLSMTRSECASLHVPDPHAVRIIDNVSGAEVPVQPMPDGSLLFSASKVPSMGYRTYRLIRVSAGTTGVRHSGGMAATLENEYYRIRMDDSTGAIESIHDKKRNIELVDVSSSHRFGQYLYQRIDRAFSRTPATYRPRMLSRESFTGPLASGIITDVAAEGCRSIRQTVVLYAQSDRIDVIVDLDKAESGRLLKQATAENKEALFYVLPFNVPDFTIHHELPGGVVEPLAHQFKGSTSGYFGIQHFADFSNTRYGVTLSTINAPLVVYGEPRAALWLAPSDAEFDARKPDRSQVSLYLMNNMFFTNIPLSQRGPASFRWSIRSHDGDWRAGKAHLFGWETSHPFETFVIEKKGQRLLPARSHSFLTIDRENVVCSTVKPAEANGEGFILRLFELTGAPATARVTMPVFGRIARATETSLVEIDLGPQLPVSSGTTVTVSIRPFGIKTIRVVPAEPRKPAPPAGVAASALSDREIRLSWTDPDRDRTSHYRIHRAATADFHPSLATCVGTSTLPFYEDRPILNAGGWMDNRLEPSTTYYYRVESVGSTNRRGAISAAVRVHTLSSAEKNSFPNKVQGLAATSVSPVSSYNYLCLIFSTNVESDVTRYRIYRTERPGVRADPDALLIEIDATQKFDHQTPHGYAVVTRQLRDYSMIVYPDESARPNRRYYYRVCAVDEAGQAGELSDEVSAISEITRLTFAGGTFFFDSARVDIRPVPEDGSEVRYTTDGSTPTPLSPLYGGPFTITSPVTIRAALFTPGRPEPAASGTAHYLRALYPPPRYLQPYSEKWPGQGPLNMVDGTRGAAYFDSYFQGFEFNDMDVVVDLGGKKEIGDIRVTMLQDIRAWIFFPQRVEFFVSHDGANFERIGEVPTVNENERKDGVFLKDYAVTFARRTTNFVRVKATNGGMCPPWHIGFEYKGKAWVFADEIVIR